jgi:hypothetical protein
MLTKDSFSEAEWAKATALPGMVMGAAALSDGRKLITTVREVVAGSNAFKEAAAKYPENALVASFLDQGQSPATNVSDENAPKPRNVAEAVELITAQIGQTIGVVKEKASAEEFAQVREVLLAAAQAAVEATGTGPLGLSGDKVGESEQAFIDKLTALLD